MSTIEVVNALELAGCGPKQSGGRFMARCPSHPDSTPSLSVGDGDLGGTLVKCHAGCSLDDVLASLHLDREVVRPPKDEPEEPIDVYRYDDEAGKVLFEVVRFAGKKFRQRRPDRKGRWIWNLGDVRRPLYRLPAVIEAVAAGDTVFVVEGEKDVGALERAGYVATCNPGGVGKWRPEHTETLRGADVIVVADNDPVGQDHARKVAKALDGVAERVRRAEPAAGKDAFDHLAAGLGVEEFLLVSEGDREAVLAPDLDTFIDAETADYRWVVPGLLEEHDRLMITGFEGQGKSELLRQIAVCVAAGSDPLRFGPIAPRKVLLIDLENSERQTRRKLRPLRDRFVARGQPVAPGMLRIIIRPNGIDLTKEADAEWLLERVRAHRPELLIVGPLYRLHAANPNDELAARLTTAALDAARNEVGCALILEAHSGHGEAGRRDLRPTGSSLWLRWPEFGFGLAPDKTKGKFPYPEMWFRVWRGQRDERAWPDKLVRGIHYPWEGVWHGGLPELGDGRGDDDF